MNNYSPTPEQIAEECLAIQSGWTVAERLRRGTHKLMSYSPPSTDSSAKTDLPEVIEEFVGCLVVTAMGQRTSGRLHFRDNDQLDSRSCCP